MADALKQTEERHVWFAILAEFDIDKGSVIRCQYPISSGAGDTFLAEAMLPEGSHSWSEDQTVFMLPESGGSKADGGDDSKEEKRPFLHCISCLIARKDDSVRRGSVTKAIAVCSPHTFVHAFQPVITIAVEELFRQTKPGSDMIILRDLYNSINSMTLPDTYSIPRLHKALVKSSRLRPKHMRPIPNIRLEIEFGAQRVVSQVPPVVGEDEIGQAALLTLLKRFPSGFMHIFNALLLEKRVIFIGHNLPAADVCANVLAACLLISPPLEGVKRRVFPYTNLTQLDTLLETPGYVAGVTNPIFAQRDAWWDVCCDLKKKSVKLSPAYEKELKGEREGLSSAPSRSGSTGSVQNTNEMSVPAETFDQCKELDDEFAVELRSGIALGRGEIWVREMVTGYVQRIVDMAFGDSSTGRIFACNQARIRMLKDTKQFRRHAEKRGVEKSSGPCGRNTGVVARYVHALQNGAPSEKTLVSILDFFLENLTTEDKLMHLLTMLPESKGGLYPLAICMYHESPSIQRKTVELLQRFDNFKEGSLWLSSLNFFLMRTYMRNKTKLNERAKTTKLNSTTNTSKETQVIGSKRV